LANTAASKSDKEYLVTYGPAILIAIIGFWVAYQFVQPAPPDRIVISAGRMDGAYYLFAKQYRDVLSRSGIDLEIRTSAGSVQNIERLRAPGESVDLAFVQGGTTQRQDSSGLMSLGSLYYEPLWVFYRGGGRLGRLAQLRAKRLAVSEPGSGTRLVALQLLKDSGIENAPTVISAIGGGDAADALLRGEVDAAFFVSSPRSPVIRRLLEASGIGLLSFERAEAYTRSHRYLSRVTLPRGVVNLQRDLPARSTVLLAPTANLVARADLHPALVDLLLQAAGEIHGSGGLFERTGEFPSADYLVYPLSLEAKRYYKRGPSFLQRYLPFWAATFVDRMIVMLIPVVALLFPLFKILPPTYRWRVRRKIYRWSRDVKVIDLALHDRPSSDELDRCAGELEQIEGEIKRMAIPLAYTDQLYNLRLHVDLVRGKTREARVNMAPDRDE